MLLLIYLTMLVQESFTEADSCGFTPSCLRIENNNGIRN